MNTNVANWLYTLAVVSVCLGLCIVPYRTTVASLSYYGAEKYLEKWRHTPNSIKSDEYTIAKSAMKQAIDYHSSFAFYHDMQSEVLQWGRYAGFEGNTDATFNDISLLYTQSLNLRTTWAVTWANLGQQLWYAKSDSNSILQVLEYLNNAHHFGKNIPEVHAVWADIGFQLMQRDFSTFLDNQDIIKLHVLKGVNHYKVRNKIIEGIKASNNAYITCVWLQQELATSNKNIAMIQSVSKRLACG